ncbi:MAG: hypothetical protein HQM08_28420 [Candidatus Riflebacteria bacterium]|nr:hypothetical protein [Candidatus Riflebacteria bacterium]
MTLKQWFDNSWLKMHTTSLQEIENLLAIAHRDLADASVEDLSDDWRFGIAYNAALKICTILLYCEGYRPAQNLAHYRTLQALPLILGEKWRKDAAYLDACRNKRNVVEYDYTGGATKADAEELMEFTRQLEKEVMKWIKNSHPNLLPKRGRKI